MISSSCYIYLLYILLNRNVDGDGIELKDIKMTIISQLLYLQFCFTIIYTKNKEKKINKITFKHVRMRMLTCITSKSLVFFV